MSARQILEQIAAEQGWSDASKITLLCRYIDTACQGDFETFLREQAAFENENERFLSACRGE